MSEPSNLVGNKYHNVLENCWCLELGRSCSGCTHWTWAMTKRKRLRVINWLLSSWVNSDGMKGRHGLITSGKIKARFYVLS